MRALVSSAARARGQSHRASPSLEHLETRALLSHLEPTISSALPAAQSQGSAAQEEMLFQQSLSPHPLSEVFHNGRVEKQPMFYPFYTGPRLPNLDVLGAKGRLIRDGGFVFTGHVLGTINASAQTFFVWGVNRGGASPPGPFPGRPQIYFDAEVIVATNPNGVEGEVERLNNKGQVISTSSLANNAVVFNKNQIQVFVPSVFLRSTSPAGTTDPQNHYSYAFWAGTSPSDPTGISGFVPEYTTTGVFATGFPS
jgi:hypothetical protein